MNNKEKKMTDFSPEFKEKLRNLKYTKEELEESDRIAEGMVKSINSIKE